MSILKLSPSCKSYIWGGDKLVKEYNKCFDGENLAETWELSAHKDGSSIIENGKYKGELFCNYVEKCDEDKLGENVKKFDDFPILVKFIDARDNLSVQVHPDDEYARINENQNGKTEMWYVVDCEKDSFLYYGFSAEITATEMQKRIKDDTLIEVLNKVYVKKGDVFFIEAGTIHAIGKGILIAEIQQNSNVTYRVYDYGRKDKYGNERELHVKKAVEVTTKTPVASYNKHNSNHLVECKYFTVDKIIVNDSMNFILDSKSFVHVLILSGDGCIDCGEESLDCKKGDSFFIEADSVSFRIKGEITTLLTRV